MELSLQEISTLLVIATAIAAMFQKVRDFVSSKLFPTRRLLREHVEREERQLQQILAELRPNDSSSMRDAVDRIEHKQIDIEAFLSAQLNVHTVSIIRFDTEGKVIYVNRAFQRIFGVSPVETMGDGWINCVYPEDRERIKNLWDSTVRSKREFNEDLRFVRVDGELLPGHINVYRELDHKNNTRGYIGVIIVGDQLCFHRESCFKQLRDLV